MGDVFKALADPTRRAILDELTDRDGQTLFEICARLATKHGLGSSRQAISQHLDVLADAGLVTTRREGRYKFHHLDTRPIAAAVAHWLPPGRDPDGRDPITDRDPNTGRGQDDLDLDPEGPSCGST